MARLPQVTDADFATRVEGAEGLVMVDFTAAWCGPCRILAPILEGLAADFAPELSVVALDVDENPATAARFGVRSMPTLLFFRNGTVVDRSVGAVPRAMLQPRIEALLAPSAV